MQHTNLVPPALKVEREEGGEREKEVGRGVRVRGSYTFHPPKESEAS